MHRHLQPTVQSKATQISSYLAFPWSLDWLGKQGSEMHLNIWMFWIGFLDLFCGKADTEREPTQLPSLFERLPTIAGESLNRFWSTPWNNNGHSCAEFVYNCQKGLLMSTNSQLTSQVIPKVHKESWVFVCVLQGRQDCMPFLPKTLNGFLSWPWRWGDA